VEYLVGALLALAVVGSAAAIGLDRGRAFYPTLLMVIASYYVLFAVMGASHQTLGVEIAAASGFSFLAVLGLKKNFWLVAVALAGHGAFDLIHPLLIENPGVPPWWPGFCLAFDGIVGAWVALRLLTHSLLARESDRGPH
jgi:hypothetical protein